MFIHFLILTLACWIQLAGESLKITKLLSEITQEDSKISSWAFELQKRFEKIFRINWKLGTLRKQCPQLITLGPGLSPFILESQILAQQQLQEIQWIRARSLSLPGKTIRLSSGFRLPPDPCGFSGELTWSPMESLLVYEHNQGPHPGGFRIVNEISMSINGSKPQWHFFRKSVLPL